MTAEPLDAQIRRLYPELSATERRLADVVLAQRAALLGYSATELAELASASKASAARFFRRLGYADFNAFRTQVRAQTVSHAPLHRLAQVRSDKSIGARLHQHALQDAGTLERLVSTADERTLQRAVSLLLRARRVWVAGYRNAYAVAFYAHALLHQVRPHVSLLNDASGRESELIADLDPRDLLLAIDLRRRTRRLPPLLRALRAGGAPLLLLTDAHVCDFENEADVVLRCPTHFGQLFDSYVAPISLVNFLAAEVAARGQAATRKRLARIEDIHVALDDLQNDSGSDRKTVR